MDCGNNVELSAYSVAQNTRKKVERVVRLEQLKFRDS